MKRTVLLISPAPVDGYPPVQSQARLLAEAGYDVRLLTSPRRGQNKVDFTCPNVRVSAWPLGVGRIRNRISYARFIAAITTIRLSLGMRLAAEIAYDPNGMMLCNRAPGPRTRRIAHFHETLGELNTPAGRRRTAALVRTFDLVVVADQLRAPVLKEQLSLSAEPVAVPNYPLFVPPTPAPARNPGFEVVYGGSISVDQHIDLIIRSVPLWQFGAKLILLGDDGKANVRPLKQLVADLGLTDRVTFEGWTATDALIDRYRRAHLGIGLLDISDIQFALSFGAGNKRYQYMQAGLPQIGDQIAGVPELLEGNGIGHVVRDYTPEAVAEIVNHYAANPGIAAVEGVRAEALHRGRYNYQQAFAPILAWLAGSRDS